MPPQFENNVPPVINPIPPYKHTRLILFIILIIIIGLLAVWYFFTPQVVPNRYQRIFPTQQITTAEQLSDWRTYKNEKYGFELKYPKDLNASEDDEPAFSTVTIGGNLLHIGVENRLVKEVDVCEQKKDTANIGIQQTNWCLDGNPDDRWVSFINKETPPVGITFYCWFPLTQNNRSVCNNILSTFKFTK